MEEGEIFGHERERGVKERFLCIMHNLLMDNRIIFFTSFDVQAIRLSSRVAVPYPHWWRRWDILLGAGGTARDERIHGV